MKKSSHFFGMRGELWIRLIFMVLPLACMLLLLSQTAFAQNTFVITDGDTVVIYTSAATDPATVLAQAGLNLDEDDTYTAWEGNGVSEITVQRNQTITVDHCGQQMVVDTFGETVEELLARLNITLDQDTTVSQPLDSETWDGMELIISRTVRTYETYSAALAHETVYVNDPSLPEGHSQVLIPGEDGQMLVKASVVYVNGLETSRNVLQETVTTQPVDEIVALGTGTGEATGNAPKIGNGIIVTAEGDVLTYRDMLQVEATAYTNTDEGCGIYTATGTIARVGAIAVDPRVIPYGTRMFIVSNDGKYVYGICTAEDCGGAINGNRVDLYYDTTAECFQFGRRACKVYILG